VRLVFLLNKFLGAGLTFIMRVLVLCLAWRSWLYRGFSRYCHELVFFLLLELDNLFVVGHIALHELGVVESLAQECSAVGDIVIVVNSRAGIRSHGELSRFGRRCLRVLSSLYWFFVGALSAPFFSLSLALCKSS